MSNSYKVTSLVIDRLLPAFKESSALFDIANTQLAYYYKNPQNTYALGQTVEILKYPLYKTTTIKVDGSQAIDIAGNLTNVQQETETLTVDNLTFTAIPRTSWENTYFWTKNKMFDEYFTNPVIKSLKKQIETDIFKEFIKRSYIVAGSASSNLNSMSSLSDIKVVMEQKEMEGSMRHLIMSNKDNAKLTDTFGTYFNGSLNTSAIRGTVAMNVAGFYELNESPNILTVDTGTASSNTGLTLSVDATDGQRDLVITGLTVNETIKVGAIITIVSDSIFTLQKYGTPKSNISQDIARPTFVVNADLSNADFTPDADDDTFGTYTAPGATMTVRVGNEVRTDPASQYQDINAPGNVLASGTSLTVMATHTANFACSTGGLTIAAPPLKPLSFVDWQTRSLKDGFSLFVARQGNLEKFRDIDMVGYGSGYRVYGDYVVRAVSAP